MNHQITYKRMPDYARRLMKLTYKCSCGVGYVQMCDDFDQQAITQLENDVRMAGQKHYDEMRAKEQQSVRDAIRTAPLYPGAGATAKAEKHAVTYCSKDDRLRNGFHFAWECLCGKKWTHFVAEEHLVAQKDDWRREMERTARAHERGEDIGGNNESREQDSSPYREGTIQVIPGKTPMRIINGYGKLVWIWKVWNPHSFGGCWELNFGEQLPDLEANKKLEDEFQISKRVKKDREQRASWMQTMEQEDPVSAELARQMRQARDERWKRGS